MRRTEIVAIARMFLRTPFQHQGRIPGITLDCAGVLVCSAAAAGIPCIDRKAYGSTPANGQLEATLAENVAAGFLVRADKSNLRPADIVLMRFNGEPQHLGLIGNGTLIHAWQPIGEVVEHRLDAVWSRRIVAAWSFAGVNDE